MSGSSNLPPPPPFIKRVDGAVLICCPHPGCNRTFAKQANYISHSRPCGTHTGETPYSCEICGLQFRWQSSQKAHMKSHERRRQRQVSDSAQHIMMSPAPGPAHAPSPQIAPRSANFQPTPHGTLLPAIRSQPPQSAPRVEALEPPVTPQSYPRRDAKITPLHPGRLGSSNHLHPPTHPHHLAVPHGQSLRPASSAAGHQSANGNAGNTESGTGRGLWLPSSRRPGTAQHHPPDPPNAGVVSLFDTIHGLNGTSALRTFPSNRSGAGSGLTSSSASSGAPGASGGSVPNMGASDGATSGTAHRMTPNDRRSRNGPRPTRSHWQ